MPKQDRIKTKYPGVYYVPKGKEKVFYIYYRIKGKQIEEKAGRQFADDMTAAKAAGIRAERSKGKELSNTARREKVKAAKLAEAGKMTLSTLWDEYEVNKAASKALKTDKGRFEKFLKPDFGNKEPHESIRLDVDRLRIRLLKKYKPQTVRHVFGLLKRIVNFGVSRQLCQNLNFKIETIKVDNIKTEDLNPEQLKKLLTAINNSKDIQAANMMMLALYTGMRRGEMFKLKWNDIDFQRGFISIKNPKGGISQKIPLNNQARQVLENHPRQAENVFVRNEITRKPGEKSTDVEIKYFPFNDVKERVNKIKEESGLPKDFRALHGLRHTYASMLASSGKVDLYTLQKLLTHKSPIMTQRYAHLRDEALRNASTLAGQIIDAATNKNVIDIHKGKRHK